MLNQIFETYLRRISASDVTEAFLWLLACCLLLALAFARNGTAPRFTVYAPNLLTSLGILGTFIGIVVGLLNFDPAQLDSSIGDLLEGLKTAFITSLAGMFTGILFKVLSTTPWLTPATVIDESEIGPAEILAALNEQTLLLQTTRDAIAGGEESSLSGQLKLLRTDLEDRHRRDGEARDALATLLWKRLDEFTQMLSRSATEQIIEALRQVIVDFNRNLTEQFGDNFKALDESVRKLVEWQERYRQQLTELHTLYDQSVQAIAKIELAVAHVAESSSSIPESMDKLSVIVETANHQLAGMERHLASFQELRDRAVAALPEVQAHVQAMTRDIAMSVQSASEHYRKLLEDSDRHIDAHTKKAQEMLDTLTRTGEQVQRDTQAVQQNVADSIRQMQRQTDAALKETLAAQNQATNQAVEGLLEQMRQSVSRTGEGVNAQLEALDQAMQQELTRVMNEMGRALTMITGKFVEDYEKLTKAMGSVVRRAGDAR